MDAFIESVPTKVKPQTPALYALPDILARGKFSKSHLYNMMERGQFPKPALVLGSRFTRWDEEVDCWFADAPAWIAAHSNVAA
ncbi:MAG: AlpA family phage regulatory protein [Polaromonas sp.]|nr:AlpA family phage regulatory protein [Polaromonas sp.]